MTHVSVASPLQLATEAGLEAGRRGGNAIDSAITAAAVLAVAYPANCGIGGDLLALVREPNGSCTFIDASGLSLLSTDVEAVRSQYRHMPIHGPLPVTVPGTVGGWSALAAHGATLPWHDLLAPAQSAAADGVPVSAGLAESIQETVPLLGPYPDLASVLCPDQSPLRAGQTLRQPALGRSLAALAAAGPSALYEGEVGSALCTGLVDRGVTMTHADLRNFSVDESQPLTLNVGGWQLQAGRPSSQAYMVLRLLGVLDRSAASNADVALHRRLSAHQLAGAFFRLSEERDSLLADPRFMTQSVEHLLTPASLQQLAHEVLADSEGGIAPSASGAHPGGDTVAVVAADDEGRSVSLIQSLFHGFGSLILEPSTGILMHDRGACFVLDPRSPNVLAPGKRPLHTLSPVLAESQADPVAERIVVGTMGGHAQPQILTQVISKLMSGASAEDAVATARFVVGAWDEGDASDLLAFESDLEPEVLRELELYPGPRIIASRQSGRTGHAHAIRVTTSETGSHFDTGTDPRADG